MISKRNSNFKPSNNTEGGHETTNAHLKYKDKPDVNQQYNIQVIYIKSHASAGIQCCSLPSHFTLHEINNNPLINSS